MTFYQFDYFREICRVKLGVEEDVWLYAFYLIPIQRKIRKIFTLILCHNLCKSEVILIAKFWLWFDTWCRLWISWLLREDLKRTWKSVIHYDLLSFLLSERSLVIFKSFHEIILGRERFVELESILCWVSLRLLHSK